MGISYAPSWTAPVLWTPTVIFGGGASTGWVFTNIRGIWMRSGQLIYIDGELTTSTVGSATGIFGISNLPYTATNNNTSGQFFSVCLRGVVNASSPDTHYQAGIAAATTNFSIAHLIAGAETFITDTSFQNATYVKFSGTYVTNQ